MQPQIQLRLHISNDCRRCCPRIFRCFCCCPADSDHYVATSTNSFQLVDRTNEAERRRTIDQLFHDVIPLQIGFDRWLLIKPEVERILGITVAEMYRSAVAIDKDFITRIITVVNKNIKNFDDSSFDSF